MSHSWMMLHCPRCLAREAAEPCCPSASVMSSSGESLPPLPPLYQNCGHSAPGSCQEEELSLLAELSSLRVKVLQNQLEQARLQEKLIKNVRGNLSLAGAGVPPLFLGSEEKEEVLKRSRLELEQSCWYYGAISWQESAILLQNTRDGTFLVRDSQDPKFLYSLSLQRSKEGPTSVRISFCDGKFSLDADPAIRRMMPQFDSIGLLISHYSEERSWSPAPSIVLRSPLYKQPPSLAHSARLSINRTFNQQSTSTSTRSDQLLGELQLPPKLVEFLRSYTLSI